MTKKNKALLLTLMGLSLAGIGGASAYLITSASADQQSGAVDSAIVLKWGETQNLGEVTGLTPTSPAYRSVSLAAPQITTSAGKKAQFTAAIGVGSAEKGSMDGLTVTISNNAYGTGHDDEKDQKLVAGTTNSVTIDVSDAVTYYLEFTMAQEAYNVYTADDPTAVFSAVLTLSYKAANVA